MKTRVLQDEITETMAKWQRVEERAVAATGQVMEQTANPLIRLIMEIIQRDSQMHSRVQAFVASSLSTEAVSLAPDELEKVSGLLTKHAAVEEQMLDGVEALLSEVKGKKLLVQEYLLNYLVEDERKHCALLAALDSIKKGLYPYG